MFREDSQLVLSYALLIKSGDRDIDSVPDVSNLREVVKNAIEN